MNDQIGAFEKLYQAIALDDDDRPVCEVCGNPKYVIQGKGILDIQRDYVIPAPCDCEESARERMNEQDRLALEKNERNARFLYIRSLKELGFVDEKQREYTFENDDNPDSEISKICKKYVKNWHKFENTNDGILLFGTVGTGKTYFACCIANALIDQGINAKVRKLSTIIGMADFNEREKAMRKLASVDLLILDDFGMESTTEYAQQLVFTLIDDRMNAKKPLIVTTNLTVEQLRKTEIMSLRRIYDRVLQQCPIQLRLAGDSKRHKGHRDRLASIKNRLADE